MKLFPCSKKKKKESNPVIQTNGGQNGHITSARLVAGTVTKPMNSARTISSIK
jgi:hypothetical protein